MVAKKDLLEWDDCEKESHIFFDHNISTCFPSCLYSDDTGPAYAVAIIEGLLIGLSDADYTVFSSDMSADMTSTIDAESFQALYEQISSKIGAYDSGSIKFNRAMEEKEIVIVFYNASFTNESGAVSVNVVFGQKDGKPVVEGLWLNSSKLRK